MELTGMIDPPAKNYLVDHSWAETEWFRKRKEQRSMTEDIQHQEHLQLSDMASFSDPPEARSRELQNQGFNTCSFRSQDFERQGQLTSPVNHEVENVVEWNPSEKLISEWSTEVIQQPLLSRQNVRLLNGGEIKELNDMIQKSPTLEEEHEMKELMLDRLSYAAQKFFGKNVFSARHAPQEHVNYNETCMPAAEDQSQYYLRRRQTTAHSSAPIDVTSNQGNIEDEINYWAEQQEEEKRFEYLHNSATENTIFSHPITFMDISRVVQDLSYDDVEVDDDCGKNLENFTLVWLDEDIFSSNVYADISVQLRHMINYLKMFNDVMKCSKYITRIRTEKVFLIVSDLMLTKIRSIIDKIPEIVAVYVFRPNESVADIQREVPQFLKLSGIFNDLQLLLNQLRMDIESHTNSIIPMTLLSSIETKEKSIKDLNIEQATFMWFQLLIELLIRSSKDDVSKEDLIHECELFYKNNVVEQQKIGEFKSAYVADDAIRWYTKDSFLYRLLNKAFRTENFEIIYKFRFFIIDLQNQLSTKYLESLEYLPESLTLYRGQAMNMNEIETFRTNASGFVSFNSFLSTTFNEDLARIFAGEGRTINEAVLFKMCIDTAKSKKPFAVVTGSAEEEVLLSMGMVFQIQSVEHQPSGLWIITLLAVELNDKQLNEFYNYIYKEQIDPFDGRKKWDSPDAQASVTDIETKKRVVQKKDDSIILVKLGHFLNDIGEPLKAERFYKMALRRLLDIRALNSIHLIISLCNSIAIARKRRGEFTMAQKTYEKTLELLRLCDQDEPTIIGYYGTVYNNIGELFTHSKEFDEQALKYFEISNEYFQKQQVILPNKTTVTNIAITYHSLGIEHFKYDNTLLASQMLQNSLSICERRFSFGHPFFVHIYQSIGKLYISSFQDFKKGLYYHNKALVIQQTLYPPNHPVLAKCYHNMAIVYASSGDREKALEFVDKSLETYLKTLSGNHPQLVPLYRDIGHGMIFKHLEKEALSTFGKALDIAFKNPPLRDQPIHGIICDIRNLIFGKLSAHAEEYLEYYERIIETDELNLSNFYIYFVLGIFYACILNHEQSLKNYEKAVETLRIYVPDYLDIIFITGLPERIESQKRLIIFSKESPDGDTRNFRFFQAFQMCTDLYLQYGRSVKTTSDDSFRVEGSISRFLLDSTGTIIGGYLAQCDLPNVTSDQQQIRDIRSDLSQLISELDSLADDNEIHSIPVNILEECIRVLTLLSVDGREDHDLPPSTSRDCIDAERLISKIREVHLKLGGTILDRQGFIRDTFGLRHQWLISARQYYSFIDYDDNPIEPDAVFKLIEWAVYPIHYSGGVVPLYQLERSHHEHFGFIYVLGRKHSPRYHESLINFLDRCPSYMELKALIMDYVMGEAPVDFIVASGCRE
ncbi:unnamed protein product [Adineta steineri]|uniref:NAD(P)(+)--arginine ADP-ribosyltransferase n=1 Tax=Adineta steineri TaxID=433720 RepID=A0A819DAX2_9BILA|nr:unnamed protein product [Adineta steineri]CAF3832477.1 unnamed protein product [Adineta steineri]